MYHCFRPVNCICSVGFCFLSCSELKSTWWWIDGPESCVGSGESSGFLWVPLTALGRVLTCVTCSGPDHSQYTWLGKIKLTFNCSMEQMGHWTSAQILSKFCFPEKSKWRIVFLSAIFPPTRRHSPPSEQNNSLQPAGFPRDTIL